MRRKFVLGTVLAAVCALVIPATSGAASMTPAGHAYEIGAGAKLTTSLGSCSISKITGTTGSGPAVTITPGSCASGTSISLSGSWNSGLGSNYTYNIGGGQITMRFSSLPGCKLASTSTVILGGTWSNGITSPFAKSGYHADSFTKLTWQNDEGSCALAGTQETVSWEDRIASNFNLPITNPVTDLTSPTTPIVVTP
jgi:hypothetical protein